MVLRKKHKTTGTFAYFQRRRSNLGKILHQWCIIYWQL